MCVCVCGGGWGVTVMCCVYGGGRVTSVSVHCTDTCTL